MKITCNTIDTGKCDKVTMSCDAKITDCDTSIFYTGMPAFLNAILSCHSCKQTGSDDQFVSIL